MKKFLRKTAAFACALLMLLSAGCSDDTGDTDSPASSVSSDSRSSGTDDKKDTQSTADTETTEPVSIPVALEPSDLKVNIAESVPVEYHTTLIDFKAMVDAVVNDDIIDNEDGTYSSPYYPYPMMSYSLTMIMPELENPTFDTFGYAIHDINGDGSPELILMCDNYALIEIYTIHNGEAKLATFFWPGFSGVITEDGSLYTETLNSSLGMNFYAIELLGTDTGYFSAIRRLGYNVTDDPSALYYVELITDEEYSVTKQEFDDFVAAFPAIPKFGENSGITSFLEFIPITIAE